MYNYNTVDGKLDRINHLKDLISKIGEIPGNHLSYLDARAISQYLIDIQKDLEKQIKVSKDHLVKESGYRYHYYFVDLNLTIYADNGFDAYEEYKKLGYPPYEGVIQCTDLCTGKITEQYPISIN